MRVCVRLPEYTCHSTTLPMPSKEESTPIFFLSILFTAHQWNYGTCTGQELLDKRTTPSAIRVCSVERRVVVSVGPTVPHTVMCTVSAKKAHFCFHIGQRGTKNTILLQFMTFLSRLCSIKTSSRHVRFYKSPRAHCTKWGQQCHIAITVNPAVNDPEIFGTTGKHA